MKALEFIKSYRATLYDEMRIDLPAGIREADKERYYFCINDAWANLGRALFVLEELAKIRKKAGIKDD